MRKSNRIWRAIAASGLSLALVGGVGLPISARAAGNESSTKPNTITEHRQEMWAMHKKMLAQAKAEDTALEKLVAELNKAPEAKKPDLEAAILTKLVAQRHQMLGEWEAMHAHMAQFRRERMQTAMNGMCGKCMSGKMGQMSTTAQK
jgi:hypothetical protein